ncbi:MAG TPA: hypothetical protein VGK94_06090 [Candidatus Polarisedimenticolia bacterium]|jgi:hypothetical protein
MKADSQMSIATKRTQFLKRAAPGILGIAVLILGAPACENNSDPIAPSDSIITVDADPQSLVVPTGTRETAGITATLRSKSGARLPDQEMTFSTTLGDLVPAAGTLFLTDENGQARCTLSTSQTTTVTARSGSVTGSTQVQTTPVAIGNVVLAVENADPSATCGSQEPCDCDDMLRLTATVEDPNGKPAGAVKVEFHLLTPLDPNSSTGPINIPGGTTENNGEFATTWRPDSQECNNKCTGLNICTWTFTATAGSFTSNQVIVTESF